MKRVILIICFITMMSACVTFAATVQEVNVPSPAMHTQIAAVVILPDSYFKTQKTYPVVYLLHGYGSSPAQTFKLAGDILTDAADTYEMIVFLPGGGFNSWYFDSPIHPEQQYQTHIADEVVQFVDSHFRTIRSAWARAITGYSMGGHGAMLIALHHTATFGSAGSLSGVVDFRPFSEEWGIKQTLGSINQFPQRWNQGVVINNLRELKAGELNIYVDVGIKDTFLEVNRALHKRLLEMGIPHIYIERPGRHDDPYWRAAIKYQLFFFNETFKEEQH
jgi:S-formylglutathione hydrolase FrmB